MRMLASAVMPATAQIILLRAHGQQGMGRRGARGSAHSLRMYSFSAEVSCSSSLDVTLRSAARTMPSLARMPMAVPACEMASSAYSTW